MVLASATALLSLAGVAATAWIQIAQDRTTRSVVAARRIAETNRLYGLAMTNPHVEIARLGEAISAAERARAALAGQMNSSEGRLAQALLAKLGQEHHDAVRDREMLARLAGIRATSSDDVLELSAIDTEYTHAFAEYGVNVDEIPVVESAAKLRAAGRDHIGASGSA